MDLATLTAAPTTVTVGGRDFVIGPLRFLDFGVLDRWLSDHFKEVGLEKPLRVGFDAGWPEALMSSQDGIIVFVQVLFSKHQELGDDDLGHILSHVGTVHLKHLWRVALELPEDDAPPKAAAAG